VSPAPVVPAVRSVVVVMVLSPCQVEEFPPVEHKHEIGAMAREAERIPPIC
jgi:hypothetical protein